MLTARVDAKDGVKLGMNAAGGGTASGGTICSKN